MTAQLNPFFAQIWFNNAVWYCILIVLSAIYYIILITNGRFNVLRFTYLGMTFNSVLEHLIHGEFDVAPEAIKSEGFIRNGKTYTYFGIVPALLRLPLLAGGNLARYDLTRLYCALAATLGLCFKLAGVALINDELPKSRLQAITFSVLVLSLVFGGAQIQFLRSSINQEIVEWAGVLAAAFVYCSLRGLIRSRGFSTRLIVAMATLAGVALLTRVSTAIGLYSALGLLLLTLACVEASPVSEGISHFARALICRRTLAALVILLAFVMLCGVVNYERWGSPLVFADFHVQILYVRMGRVPRIVRYGEFNIERLWYGVIYYFFPIWIFVARWSLLICRLRIQNARYGRAAAE